MTKEKIRETVYVSKYAQTSGVIEVTGYYAEQMRLDETIFVEERGQGRCFYKNEWHRDKKCALQDAVLRIDRAAVAARKKLQRLQNRKEQLLKELKAGV